MNRPNQTPILFIIIIIIIAAIVLVKFSKEKNLAVSNLTPTPTVSVGGTPQGKLPAGSAAPGSADMLIGKIWKWEKTVMNNDNIVTPKQSDKFTLTLNTDGTVSGKTDCNGFSGGYQIGSDGIIKFGPLASTKMFCDSSQEADFVGPISKVQNYSLDTVGGKLLMYFNEGLMILAEVK